MPKKSWQQQKKKGYKRKKNNSFSTERAKKKHITDTSDLDFSMPLKESTLIVDEIQDDEAILVDEHYDQSSEDVNQEKEENDTIVKLKDTIEFLRKLCQAKDDILHERETEKCFLQTKVDNIEALLIVKDETIKKLTTQVNDLTKLANVIKPRVMSIETETSKSSEVVTAKGKDKVTEEKERREVKKKCKYEDRGKCKSGDKCPFTHPKITCQAHAKLNACPNPSICAMRHPVKMCFQWEREGNCSRGDSCRFQHPLELLKRKHFLGKRPPPQQHPQLWHQQQQPLQQPTYLPTTHNMIQPWSLPMNNFWLTKQSLNQ